MQPKYTPLVWLQPSLVGPAFLCIQTLEVQHWFALHLFSYIVKFTSDYTTLNVFLLILRFLTFDICKKIQKAKIWELFTWNIWAILKIWNIWESRTSGTCVCGSLEIWGIWRVCVTHSLTSEMKTRLQKCPELCLVYFLAYIQLIKHYVPDVPHITGL